MGTESPVLSPEESFISMRELDPLSVDDSPIEIAQADYFPADTQKPTAPFVRSTTSLGLGDHSTAWWCQFTGSHFHKSKAKSFQ